MKLLLKSTVFTTLTTIGMVEAYTETALKPLLTQVDFDTVGTIPPYNMGTQSYALTQTGIDLFLRGMMRSMSADPEQCHSCMQAYNSVYYATLSAENAYYEWTHEVAGIDGSYRMF